MRRASRKLNGAINALCQRGCQGYLHFVFQLLLKHSIELLHVVLHEGVVGVPAKGLCQVLCRYAAVAKLQLHNSTHNQTKLLRSVS